MSNLRFTLDDVPICDFEPRIEWMSQFETAPSGRERARDDLRNVLRNLDKSTLVIIDSFNGERLTRWFGGYVKPDIAYGRPDKVLTELNAIIVTESDDLCFKHHGDIVYVSPEDYRLRLTTRIDLATKASFILYGEGLVLKRRNHDIMYWQPETARDMERAFDEVFNE